MTGPDEKRPDASPGSGAPIGSGQRKPRTGIFLAFLAVCGIVLSALLATGNPLGERVARSMLAFGPTMLAVLPAAFVIIGLFEIWVPRAVVERHVGKDRGILSYIWAVVLAGTTVGGIYVSFPVALALRHKGAGMGFIMAYISLSGVARIPMTVFELSTLGPAFTIIRYAVSVPLVVIVSHLWGKRLEGRGYELGSM